MEIVKTDILIIGSGAAGLAAGVYAALSGQEVLVIDKGAAGKSGSTVGAVQVASLGEWSDPDDSAQAYRKDVLASGRGLSNPDLVDVLVNEASARMEDLLEWGLKLDRSDQEAVAVSATSGHSVPRSVSSKKGKAGLGILQTLTKKAKRCRNLRTWSDVITLELVKSEAKVSGAVVWDLTENKAFLVQSKTVILATGGTGQLYPITSNPVQATGDGFSLGLNAGASLIDMEQIQFYPVSVLKPRTISGLCLSFYHIAKLYNSRGERFMKKYEPETLENTTRDKLSVAIATEVAEGSGTPSGGVWMDASETTDEIKELFYHEYKLCQDHGTDLGKEWMETGPAAHFTMGGMLMDSNGASTVPRLFVAGETAGGLHGGNRLGNNALPECLVFGARAGKAAAKETEKINSFPAVHSLEMDRAEEMLSRIFSSANGVERTFACKERIQQTMGRWLGVIRSTDGLRQAKIELNEVRDKLRNVRITTSTSPYSREIIDYIEATHMVQTALAVTEAAFARKESRGAHYNPDFPEQLPKAENTILSMEDEKLCCKLCAVEGE